MGEIGITCRSDLAPATDVQNPSYTGELPRKKSRNYLDSHKNIEKKRRDRINQCLSQLKALVPDCRQYVCSQSFPLFVVSGCVCAGE